ncbi:MAG: sialidase family protein [Thermoplasmata archaeon]
MEYQTERLTRGALIRVLTVIAVAIGLLAFISPLSEGTAASDPDTSEMSQENQGSSFEMRAAPAEARRQVTPAMIRAQGVPIEAVHTGMSNLGILTLDDCPNPTEPPFGPDGLIYSSASTDHSPRIAMNPTDGVFWVTFTHFNGLDDDVYLFYSDDTGITWNPALQTTGMYNERNPSIAIAGNTIMIAYEQDEAGEEQLTYFIRSQDGGMNWESLFVDWAWTNDPTELQLEDFNDLDISAARPQWFHWAASAWGVRNATRTVAFMWTEDDGETWSTRYWNATGHMDEDFERPVIMENSVDEYMHMAWQRENLTEGGYDVEWMIVDHALTDVRGWWTAEFDGGNTEVQPDIWIRDDLVYLVWQNGTGVDSDLTGFYSDDGGASVWFLFIEREDGYGLMYPAVYLDDKFEPHISAVNGTGITYLNNTDVLTHEWRQVKADDSPGNVVSDFRATDIICVLNAPRIVFSDNRLGASDIWYTGLGDGCSPITVTVTHSPLIAVGDILVDGVPCSGTCGYAWILGSAHSLQAPTFMTDPIGPNGRFIFSSWSDGGAQNHTYIVPSSPETLTAYYDPQYNITLATAPDPNLELLIDSVPYTAPQSFWWTLGEQHNLEAPSPQGIDGTSRYVWSSWSDGGGRSHSVTITHVETLTATFEIEYVVNITTFPVGLDVEVDGLTYTTPVSFWWLDGSVHDLNAISPQYVSQDERFRYVYWSDGLGITHPIVVSGPETITAYYTTQYNISFTTSPPGLIVEVDGVEYTTPVSFFFDVGSVHTMHVPSPQSINPGSQYTWQFWNDMGLQTHDITVTGPATYTANFGVEFRIDIITNPHGLNIAVDGVEHTAPYSFWCPQGSSLMIGAPSPQLQTPTMRYRWDSWSDMGTQSHPIICNQAKTIIVNFVAQFLINVTSDPVLFTDVGWYDVGATLTLNAPSPIQSGNVRYVFSHWNDGGAQSHIVTVTAPATYIAYYDTQYLITVTSTPVTGLGIRVSGVPQLTEYQFWCYAEMTYIIGAPSPQDGPVTGSRYVWLSWSDGLGQWHNITCTGPDTYTAYFVLQYRLTITAPQVIDFDGITRNAPYWPWCDFLSVHNIGAPSPQPQIPGSSQYAWTSWSDGGAQYHNITVTGPTTYLSSWSRQYKITITTDPEGLEVLVNGVPQTTPYVVWWDESSLHSLDVTSPQEVVPGAERYVWNWWSDSQPKIHTIIVAMSNTYTAHLSHQFRVIVDSTPVGGIAVTVNGSQYPAPYSFWCDNGISVSISGIEFHDVGSGVRYAFASWSDGGARTHNIQCNMPKTLTATYTTQYYLTLISACDPQGEGWYDSGTTATFSTTSPCPSGAPHTRYVFIAWIGDSFTTMPNASIVMDGPKTVTATWSAQHYLTVHSNYGTPTGEGWYDSGATAYAGLDVDIYTVGTTRYVFAQWTGDATGTDYAQSSAVVMDAPMTVTAQWTTQYFLTLTSAYGDPTGEGWYDSGATATFSVTTPYAGTTGTQYVFSAWSGDSTTEANPESVTMNGPMSVTAQWTTEYQLTVTSAYGNPQGAGWYSSGSRVTFSVTSPSAGATGVQYVLGAWTGDFTSTSASTWITMDAPKTATAQWTTQYYLKVSSNHGYPQGAGWHDAGTEVRFSVTSPFTSGSVKYEFTGWSGDSSSKKTSDTILMDGPRTVEAEWRESGNLADFWWTFLIAATVVTVVILALWMMKRRPG